MLILLTVSLSGYLYLDASWSVCVGSGWSFFFSFFFFFNLFYLRNFIEISGSEPSDCLRFCIAMVVMMIPLVVEASWFLFLGYDYFLLPPKAYTFTEAVPDSDISIFFNLLSQVRKFHLSVSFLTVSLTSVVHNAWGNLVPVTPRDSLVQLLDLELSQLWFQPVHCLNINPPQKRTATAFPEA